jgi:hypothetical protein
MDNPLVSDEIKDDIISKINSGFFQRWVNEFNDEGYTQSQYEIGEFNFNLKLSTQFLEENSRYIYIFNVEQENPNRFNRFKIVVKRYKNDAGGAEGQEELVNDEQINAALLNKAIVINNGMLEFVSQAGGKKKKTNRRNKRKSRRTKKLKRKLKK